MMKSKKVAHLLTGIFAFALLYSCDEEIAPAIIEEPVEVQLLEGMFIQLDSPGTSCDWILETTSDTYGFGQPIEDFFQVKSILFDTQYVVVRYDSIIQSDNCENFDQWLENQEIFEQKPLITDTQLLDEPVQFAARIDSLTVLNDYLIVDYAASGCDRFTWEVALVDTGEVLESSPPQRNLVFWFSNRGGCAAETEQKAIFNIQSLQLAGEQIQLNVSNNGSQSKSVIYTY